ncbi:hypothetical protein GHK92_19850 [Nocardioides sp. dk4132]|uniref:metallophosphoesterase family protein n=1 Tax=unclassified Nocardioides TaxID=2615069 RepID=UPI001295D6A3|nr:MULTISPECIES: metallophosphoesterase [unclassified Nocardioides]MQW78126.1 hypothetical protein [Nocardioides sp. dk4132]QGA09052.1 hypothetical protein GFH29_17855 [Nocardioides sp. dk884]
MNSLDPMIPDLARTIHVVGDQHHGSLAASRKALLEAGLAQPLTRWINDRVAACLHMGDLTNNATDAEDNLYVAHRGHYGDAPLHAILGNHDIRSNRNPEEHAAALGLPGSMWTAEIERMGVTIVGVLPGTDTAAHNSGSQFTSERLARLDSTLAGIDGDVWIACHFPMHDTVNGSASDPAIRKRSVTSGYYVATTGATSNSNAVLEMLDDHSNVKAWLSAHIHADLTADRLLTTVSTGSRGIAHINTGAVAPLEVAQSPRSQINTFYLTKVEGGIEVRVRGHHAGGYWESIGGRRVTLVPTS